MKRQLNARVNQRTLIVLINVDGIPMSKSSNNQFWTISAQVKNIRGAKPFPVGIYEGYKKPEDGNAFIRDLIEEGLVLQTNGVTLCNKRFSVHLKFCFHAPARALVTGVKSHSAFYGCSKCTTKGTYVRNLIIKKVELHSHQYMPH
jgi:hypothetical protein